MTKPPKKTPGRPKKDPQDKLEQFSVRLPPNLKFGLELLANHQRRSISDAVQWAVRVGLNSWPVTPTKKLGDLFDRIWQEGNTAARVLAANEVDPALLAFEDRIAAELVKSSVEYRDLVERLGDIEHLQGISTSSHNPAGGIRLPRKKLAQLDTQLDQSRSRYDDLRRLLPAFIDANWDGIRHLAANFAESGRSLEGRRILAVIEPRDDANAVEVLHRWESERA